MKLYDKVKITVDKNKYNKEGVRKGDIGTIVQECLMFTASKVGSFDVMFFENSDDGEVYVSVAVCDMEVVEESSITDEELLEGIPMRDPSRYCKVVDGYIMNLNGAKLNKVPYKYDSWGEGYED